MRLLRNLLTLLLIPAFSVLYTGCASTRGASDMEVSLADLRFSESTIMETTLDLMVRIENASPEPLRVTGSVHRLYVNGTYLGRAMSGEETEVPRFGSTTQRVKVHLSNLRVAGRIRDVMGSQTIAYRLQSTVHTGRRSLSATREGSFSLAAGER